MCLHAETERINCFYEEGQIVEYTLQCCQCDKILDIWSYGEWMGVEEE